MNAPVSQAPYVLGHTPGEIRRLDQQAELMEPTTRWLFEQAGIRPGMRVLDLGSGPGAVAMLAADLVGPEGSVVGVEASADAIVTAQARAEEAGRPNVTFRRGDLSDPAIFDGIDELDAVIGRCVLCFLPDPALVLRRIMPRVRSNGVFAFHETGYHGPVSIPDSPLLDQIWAWMNATTGPRMDRKVGLRLHSVFKQVGLPTPQMRMDAYAGGGADWIGYDVIAGNIRSMLPQMIEDGIATAEEVDIDTLADRLRAETVPHDGTVCSWSFVTAWARRP